MLRLPVGRELAVLAMELTWLELLLLVLWDATGGEQAVPVWLLGVVGPAALFTAHSQPLAWPRLRGLDRMLPALLGIVAIRILRYPDRPALDAGWLLAFLAAAAGLFRHFPPDLVLLAAAPVFWWRAGAVASAELNPRSVTTRFQYGLLPLALAALLAEARRPTETAVAVIAYFAAGLVAAGLARDRSGHAGSTAWGVLGLAVGAAIGSLALGLAAVLSGGSLGVLLAAVTSPIAALFRLLGSLFDGLAGPSAPDEALPIASGRPPVTRLIDFDPFGMLPPWLQSALAIAAIVIALYGLAVTLSRIAERIRLRFATPGSGGDAGEPTGDGFGADLRLLWRRFLAWLARIRFGVRPGAPVSGGPGAPPLSPEALEVRQIYRALLDLGAQHGAYRWPASTPSEHLPALQGALMPATDECRRLTELYLTVRYGAKRPGEAERREAREWWGRTRVVAEELVR